MYNLTRLPPRSILPSFTLEVRMDNPLWRRILVISTALGLGLALSLTILVIAGVPAGNLAGEFAVTLLDAQSIHAVLVQAAPLILVGAAAAIAFRARYWNLGLEGQMIMGGVAATAVSIWQIGPEASRLVTMGVAAAVAGAAWVVFPTLLKLRLKVSEIISTLLLNYIAMYFMYHLLFGAWKDPRDSYPYSPEYKAFERLPELWHGIGAGYVLALMAVALLIWLAQLSRFGFSLRFVHDNPNFARRAGLWVAGITVGSVLVSGVLAGMAGFVVSASIQGRLTQGFFTGYGFSGILIAFLARNNPAAVVVVGMLYAVLFVTGQNLQVFYQVPFAVVQLIQAIIVICVAGSDFFLNHRLVRRV